MLGNTANGLFWTYRLLERAENMSRLIETGQRIALTRLNSSDEQWLYVMQTAAVASEYKRYYSKIEKEAALDWMLKHPENKSSILSSITSARQNAKMVRHALTTDVWEAINGSFLDIQNLLKTKIRERDLPIVLRTIKQSAALVRGATYGTMLRNEEYDFCRLGTFIERADNTARILDVKYYVLLPSAKAVGTSIDNVQWETILRSVSAYGGFRLEYGHEAGPGDIAKFLILDKRMPRSLIYCSEILKLHLSSLCSTYRTKPASFSQIMQLQKRFLTHDIEAIFKFGLHDFLQKMISLFADLSDQIEIDYRFYE